MGQQLTTLAIVDVPGGGRGVLKSRSWDSKFQRKYPYLRKYPNFLRTQCRIVRRKEACMPKMSSICSAIDTILGCDRHMETGA